ncbi:UNKNOWN [Stylonychia lemnae]|uniref:Protein BIG1 n=1 Tax=Stylonychia lemnae TaxID=5949 RepID=A0A078A7E4_STYLE|nr:UNKNOWN [Stylonychia lemnae]|eukprot:CDW78170.1 UNKNOWN [Stylonychia lemnae]
MKVLSFATLCLASLISYSVKANYPFVVYSTNAGNSHPVEFNTTVGQDSVVAKYQDFVVGKTNVLVFVKDGLTTSEFVQYASQSYVYLKNKIMGNSVIYTDVNSGFDSQAFEQTIDPVHMNYNIDNLADVDSVNNQLKSDLSSTNALFKISLFKIGEMVPNSAMDKIVKTIEESAEKIDGKSAVVIAGSKSIHHQSGIALSLVQLNEEGVVEDGAPEEETAPEANSDEPTIKEPVHLQQVIPSYPGIQKYLFPNALIGILFTIFMISILIIGFLQLFVVQTPYFYPNESIDFGKIEK